MSRFVITYRPFDAPPSKRSGLRHSFPPTARGLKIRMKAFIEAKTVSKWMDREEGAETHGAGAFQSAQKKRSLHKKVGDKSSE